MGRHPNKHTPEHRAKLSAALKKAWLTRPRRATASPNPYPAGFNDDLKEHIRSRDGHICQVCSKTQEENGKALGVHHIDQVKENLQTSNLISLCPSCHGYTGRDKPYWETELRKKTVVGKHSRPIGIR